jgi:phospholipid/cholesterol/gamma-HCH transport system ATP-binding protein
VISTLLGPDRKATEFPAIETIDLAVGSPEALLVCVNWPVGRGDFWAVGGSSGSGKSELLAVMSGLHRPREGRLKWFGKDAGELRGAELLAARLRLGLLFESGDRLFPHLTVEENIALPLSYHHNLSVAEGCEYVGSLLAATDLIPWAKCPSGHLKPALRRRAALARALANGPEVLLLDNPLAGLNPRESRWWREFLGRLAAGNELTYGRPLTLIVACPDLRPWVNCAKQFALAHERRFLPLGDRAALARREDPPVRELLAEDPAVP